VIGALLVTVASVSPCSPVERLPPDPALARVYAKVAREEETQTAVEAAAAAWRMSAALEPEGGEADRALRRLCEQEQQVDFKSFRARDCRPSVAGRPEAGCEAEVRDDSIHRVIVDAAFEAGYDANPTASPTLESDGFASATANLTARPLGSSGPFLSLGGGYRKYVRFPQADLGLAGAAVGWQLSSQRLWASMEYGLDFVSLGASPWLLRNRAGVRLLLAIGAFVLSAEYGLRYDALLPIEFQLYSGMRHDGFLAGGVRLGPHRLELAALVTRAEGEVAERSFLEGGAELRWLFRASAAVDLWAALTARHRAFDGRDPDLGVVREELQFDALLRADWELTESLSLFGLMEARRLSSNVDALSYTRVAASAGVRLCAEAW
jgi:hypothetical protein